MHRKSIFICGALAAAMAGTVQAQDNPTLTLDNTYMLNIPSVDFSGVPGFYQDGVFVYDPALDMWDLLRARVNDTIEEVENVELVTTDEVPMQALLRITGTFPDGCPEVGPAALRREGNLFDVRLYYVYESVHDEDQVCTQALEPFSTVVPLPVYGLEAGEYEYSVNGEFTGSFTLDTENSL